MTPDAADYLCDRLDDMKHAIQMLKAQITEYK